MNVLHQGGTFTCVGELLNACLAEGVNKIRNLSVPKEIRKLELVCVAFNAACPCSVGFVCTVSEGKGNVLVFCYSGAVFLAAVSVGLFYLPALLQPCSAFVIPGVSYSLHFLEKCVFFFHGGYLRFLFQGLFVSPAGSVGASAFGRGVHRTPAPFGVSYINSLGCTYQYHYHTIIRQGNCVIVVIICEYGCSVDAAWGVVNGGILFYNRDNVKNYRKMVLAYEKIFSHISL